MEHLDVFNGRNGWLSEVGQLWQGFALPRIGRATGQVPIGGWLVCLAGKRLTRDARAALSRG